MTIFWLIAAVILFIVEAVCPVFFMFWFAIGAILALITSFITSNIITQFVVFFVSTTIFIIFIKPLTNGLFKNNTKDELNMNGIVGKKAIVIEDIDNFRNIGKVKINGEVWKAANESESEIISSETQVDVIRVDGVKLIVKKADSTND